MRGLFALSVSADLTARLALFGTALVLVVDDPFRVEHAALLAGIATATTWLRSWTRASLTEGALRRALAILLEAVRKKTVAELVANRDRERAASLIYETAELADGIASIVPDLIASILMLGAVLVAVALRLGLGVLGLGLLGSAALLVLLTPVRRRTRRLRERAFRAQFRAERLIEALILGAFELRASSADTIVSASVLGQGGAMGRALRDAQRMSAVLAVLPALIALGLWLLPRAIVASLLESGVAELGVLGAVGVGSALRTAETLESYVRVGPARAALGDFTGDARVRGLWGLLEAAPPEPALAPSGEPLSSLAVEELTIRHGDGPETPSRLGFEARRGAGVALVGPNGAGKSTALLALAGLVAGDGRVLVDGRVPSEASWPALRRRFVVVPQRPHVAPDEPIAWHVGLFGAYPLEETALVAALDRLGLGARLSARARQRGVDVGALPMGELSGGEQRRVALTRTLLVPADVVLLDEPEAGLDEAGRRALSGLLDELAKTHVVVVAAHDFSVVPTTFTKVIVTARA